MSNPNQLNPNARTFAFNPNAGAFNPNAQTFNPNANYYAQQQQQPGGQPNYYAQQQGGFAQQYAQGASGYPLIGGGAQPNYYAQQGQQQQYGQQGQYYNQQQQQQYGGQQQYYGQQGQYQQQQQQQYEQPRQQAPRQQQQAQAKPAAAAAAKPAAARAGPPMSTAKSTITFVSNKPAASPEPKPASAAAEAKPAEAASSSPVASSESEKKEGDAAAAVASPVKASPEPAAAASSSSSSSSSASAPAPTPSPKADDAAKSLANLKLDAEEAKELAEAEEEERRKRIELTTSYAQRKGHDEREHVNIVFIGHVDAGTNKITAHAYSLCRSLSSIHLLQFTLHFSLFSSISCFSRFLGKSTISGQVLLLTGQVDERTIQKYEKEAKEKNRESWYLAYVMDTSEEERAKGKTVEVGRAHFNTSKKRYTLLDAPGHKSFVPNMITGAAQADVGVLVISARQGEFEAGFDRGGQTREHAMLAKTLGLFRLVILVNKMVRSKIDTDYAHNVLAVISLLCAHSKLLFYCPLRC